MAGRTTYQEALAGLRARGVTNLAASEGQLPSGQGVFQVLTGDRLNRVFFFRGRRFERQVGLHAYPGTDVVLSVKAVVVSGITAVMVIGPELATERGTLGMIVVKNDASDEFATIPRLRLTRPSAPHLPLVLGDSLDTGVFYTARNQRGDAWDQAFLIRFERGAMRVAEAVSVRRLLGSSSARHWYFEPGAWLSSERRLLEL